MNPLHLMLYSVGLAAVSAFATALWHAFITRDNHDNDHH